MYFQLTADLLNQSNLADQTNSRTDHTSPQVDSNLSDLLESLGLEDDKPESLGDDELVGEEEPPPESPEDSVTPSGIVQAYLLGLKERLSREIEGKRMPKCYQQHQFWIHPHDAYFAMRRAQVSADGLSPHPLYMPPVFVWLPHLLEGTTLKCQSPQCHHHPLTVKGWNDNPVARRVVSLEGLYYVITQRVHCDKRTGGCGKSMNLYDPVIMEQISPGLAAAFPAFLTHRSGIDKTLMTLIRAGIAHRVSSSAWSKILRELHVRRHDLQELHYLHAIHNEKKKQHAVGVEDEQAYEPFSEFHNKDGYAGFYPSCWYINTVYMDYMEHICPILDQCVAALTGYVLKWDHSFKIVKLMMKLNGEVTFAALFTLLNEYSQIRCQAFVPTKSLSHLRAGLEEMVKSLEKHGLAQPILGFSDNVASDVAFFTQHIPSLAKNINAAQFDEFSDLPTLVLPEHVTVHVCTTEAEITVACNTIMESLPEESTGQVLKIGYDQEWGFQTGQTGTGPQRTALIQLALPSMVYVIRTFLLKKLPASLQIILTSSRILKVGRNVGGDFAKLERDFSVSLPKKTKGCRPGVIELGALAKAKNAVSNGNASLSAIAAATIQQNLAKEMRSSDWDAAQLSTEQIQYAALDAWVALQILDILEQKPTVGQPLKFAAPVGQPVSLYSRKQEVARGHIIQQPAQVTIKRNDTSPSSITVNVTKTRAVMKVDEVLVPDHILSFYKNTIQKVQEGRPTFDILVSLSSLKTRSSHIPLLLPGAKAPDAVMDDVTLIRPPSDGIPSEEDAEEPSATLHDDDDNDHDNENMADRDMSNDVYAQPKPLQKDVEFAMLVLLASILADIFHEMHKVCRTISEQHSLHKQFTRAFSDTMLVPDKHDKA